VATLRIPANLRTAGCKRDPSRFGATERTGRRLDVEAAFLSFHLDAGGRLVEVQSSFWRDVFVLPENPMPEAALRLHLTSALARAPGTPRAWWRIAVGRPSTAS
jgi:hypothetical protein